MRLPWRRAHGKKYHLWLREPLWSSSVLGSDAPLRNKIRIKPGVMEVTRNIAWSQRLPGFELVPSYLTLSKLLPLSVPQFLHF